MDRAFGIYLPEQVQAGYRYLMKYYNDGDKICIFGPSGLWYTLILLGIG